MTLFQPRELFPDRSARDLFGAEVRRHREKAGMSLRALSEVLNYSKSHLARIEAAESLPYDDLPAKLDACFGTDASSPDSTPSPRTNRSRGSTGE